MAIEGQDLAVYSLEDGRAIFAAYRRLVALGILDDNGRDSAGITLPVKKFTNATASIYVRNDSGFVIPPYGIMQSTNTVNVPGSNNYANVKRPIDSTLMRSPLLINGPREVAIDGYGVAQPGPVFRLLHDGAHTYEPGDRLGSLNGSFAATYGALYAVLGADDIATNIVRVMFDTSAFKGKTKSTPLVVGTPSTVFFRDAAGVLTAKEYLAETDVSDIPSHTEIWLFPMYGRLVASEVC